MNLVGTPGNRNGTESFFGASVGCAGCINSQPTHPSDETLIKPRSRVERLPPSPHVKEPSIIAHYEHYAHDE